MLYLHIVVFPFLFKELEKKSFNGPNKSFKKAPLITMTWMTKNLHILFFFFFLLDIKLFEISIRKKSWEDVNRVQLAGKYMGH